MKQKIWLFFFCFFFIFFIIAFYSMTRKPLPRPTLKVLTYSSFVGVYGAGRIFKKDFEKYCDCTVQWFLAEDSTALLQRFLILPKIDMVLGWDQISKLDSNPEFWEDLSIFKKQITLQSSFVKSKEFIPFDWSAIGFIYKDKKYKINRLKDLKNTTAKISFPGPITSTLGLQFYYWIYEVFNGNKKEIAKFLEQIQDKVYGSVPSWSLAYGFFRKDQTQMGLSYLSSLLYHQQEEANQEYFFSNFEEGHPYQVEFFSISKKSKNKQLALSFAKLLLSQKGQKILLDKNYMLPVSIHLESPLLNQPELLTYKYLNEFIANKKELLELWKKHLH